MNYHLKNMRPVAAALGLVALMGTMSAHAADVIMEEPPVPAAPMAEPPVATWTGAYAGVTGGYAFAGRTEDEGFDNTINTDGFLLNGFVGYNYQVGNIVAGAEADIGYSWEDGSNAGSFVRLGRRGLASCPSRLRRFACRPALRNGRWRGQGPRSLDRLAAPKATP